MGYDLARQFGLKIQPTKPALVPLVLGTKDRAEYCDLAGVSAEVIASTDHQAFREKMLITHRGLSGPAILQISSYWEEKQPIRIDLAPDREHLRRDSRSQGQKYRRCAVRSPRNSAQTSCHALAGFARAADLDQPRTG